MSDALQFQLSETEVLKVLSEYVNRTLFKKPVTLTSIERTTEGEPAFEFVAITATKEPRTSKAKKAPTTTPHPKRGLRARVLEPQANGQDQVGQDA